MARKARQEVVEESSEEEMVVRKVQRKAVASSSEEAGASEKEEEDPEKKKIKKVRGKRRLEGREEEGTGEVEGRKRKVVRCAESSDEEPATNGVTPKADRVRKLEEMRSKLSAKKGSKKVLYDTSSEEEGPDPEVDEDDLPQWENEEAPPEEASSGEDFLKDDPDDPDEQDLEGFVVDDDNEDGDVEAKRLPDSEEEDTVEETGKKKKISKRRTTGRKKRKAKVESESESEEDNERRKRKRKSGGRKSSKAVDDDSEEESEEEAAGWVNPYMVDEEDSEDILARLRRDTKTDRENKKNYKKEVGKYQFAVHSSRNKAALMCNKRRFANTMATARFDLGLKEDRALDKGDSEFYEYKEVPVLGEQVRIYPHTRRVNKFSSARCQVSGCRERFEAGVTKIVGCMMLEIVSCRFRKKQGAFGKEVFYWICGRHEPLEEGEEMDSYPEDWTDEETKEETKEEAEEDPHDPDVKIEPVVDSDDPEELDTEDFIVDECKEEEDIKVMMKKSKKFKNISESEEEVPNSDNEETKTKKRQLVAITPKSDSEDEEPKLKQVKTKNKKLVPKTPKREEEEPKPKKVKAKKRKAVPEIPKSESEEEEPKPKKVKTKKKKAPPPEEKTGARK